jgi:EmrB/QacA subfamily drug resistance transporter
MAFIDQTALSLVLPTLQEELDASGGQLLWAVNAYLIFLASLILVGGSLGDHFGRKRVFMLGTALFTLASALCGLAPTIEFFIAARALQGIGGALMVPGSLAILSALFGDERGAAIGTWSAFSTITTIAGPILGGALVSLGLWRGIFFINLPLAMISLYAMAKHVPENRDESAPAQLDYLGGLLASLGLGGITYAFIQSTEGEASQTVIGGAGLLGVVCLILFVIVEARSRYPMVPLGLFRSRVFSGTNAMTLFLYAALGLLGLFLPLNLIQIQGYEESAAGFAFLPVAICIALISRRMGRLSDRIGSRLPLTIGSSIVGLGFLILSTVGLTSGQDSFATTILPPMMFVGLGMGMVVAPLTAAVMGAVPSQQAGIASGVNNAVARGANVLAVAIVGSIALLSFGSYLETETAALDLMPEQRAFLEAEASNLAAAAPPPGLSLELTAQTDKAIQTAFLDTFQLVCWIGAGLCFLSAALSFFIIGDSKGRASTVLVSPME